MSAINFIPPITVIDAAKLEELRNDSILLNCLRNAGVANWDGWDFAVEVYQEIVGGG